MATPPSNPPGFSLRRWSQRKREATRPLAKDGGAPGAGQAAPIGQDSPTASAAPTAGAAPTASPPSAPRNPPELRTEGAASPLPPVESLTADSDFAAFMRPEVDDMLKRGALKKLFSDPRFNVMDGLDTYIDDYSKPDPLDPVIARALVRALCIVDEPGPATASTPTVQRALEKSDESSDGRRDAPGTPAESTALSAPVGPPDKEPGTAR